MCFASHIHQIGSSYVAVVDGSGNVITTNLATNPAMLEHPELFEIAAGNPPAGYTKLYYITPTDPGSMVKTSAATLSLSYGVTYVATGTTATYTLPAVSANTIGMVNGVNIINMGSGNLTVSGTMYNTGSITTWIINPGYSISLVPTGTTFKFY